LFDQGFFVKGTINGNWSQYMFSDFILYRNGDQIALASTPAASQCWPTRAELSWRPH
jgi:hypothetical protein